MDNFTRETDKRFTLRIDKVLFEKLESEAAKEKRAIGRQIEYILEQYYFTQNNKDLS